ncbi:biotin transporter BioY [Alkaliphilus transvaalensis]|uniref:biotin transporter BioY n=1 Tax=Alkaliphilus transvaalensis TaxID=114628 RepID=UPI00047EA808|nr:biotin transporter BioY [Alkaliphilus transvaalensis]
MKISVKQMTLVALFAALTAVSSQIAVPVPFSPVPFTMQVVAVCLAGGILGRKLGSLSIIIYLLLGAIGLPVFAHFSSGLHILVGPTGGFLLSFPLAAYVIGSITEKKITYLRTTIAMLLALILIYGIGLIQFKYVTSMTWEQSFLLAVANYIIPDLIKIVLTSAIVMKVSHVLERNNLKVSMKNS